MGAQVAAEKPGDADIPSSWLAFQVAPGLCRQLCCEAATEDVPEVWDAAKSTTEDGTWTTQMLQASYQRAVGWPEHFEKELDELRILGVLGFELRGLGPRPPHRFHSGAIYVGQWCGNQRHGLGRQTWPDGAQYEGCWSNSSASGYGRFKFPDGSVYLGQWRGNRFHGYGAHYLADGSSYHGEWVHGHRDGVGVETCVATEDGPGSTYWGEFCRGQKEGLGIGEWDEGSRYVGQWRAGISSGYGVLTSDGASRSYRGQFLHAKKHGRGVYTWPDGREHRGHYLVDVASGFGTFCWPDKSEYHGFWRNARILGSGGVFVDADGNIGPLPPGRAENLHIPVKQEDEDLTEIDLELASTPSSLTLAEQTARVDVDEPVKVMQVLIQPKKRKGPSAEKEKRVRFLAAQGGA